MEKNNLYSLPELPYGYDTLSPRSLKVFGILLTGRKLKKGLKKLVKKDRESRCIFAAKIKPGLNYERPFMI